MYYIPKRVKLDSFRDKITTNNGFIEKDLFKKTNDIILQTEEQLSKIILDDLNIEYTKDIKELKQKLDNENVNIVTTSYSCDTQCKIYIVYRNNIEFAKYRQTFETKFEGLNSKIVVTVERIE